MGSAVLYSKYLQIYMSPENLSGEPYIPEKNDVWSLGVIIF